MKRIFISMLVGLFVLSACNTATGIEISDAWARPAMKGGNGAVYFLLQNHSSGADELTGVSSDVAEAVEMHETKMDGDVMQMQQVLSIPIQGKASLAFAPGRLHVMLIGLKQDLEIGEEFQITLQFANEEDITLLVPVQEGQGNSSTSDH